MAVSLVRGWLVVMSVMNVESGVNSAAAAAAAVVVVVALPLNHPLILQTRFPVANHHYQ